MCRDPQPLDPDEVRLRTLHESRRFQSADALHPFAHGNLIFFHLIYVLDNPSIPSTGLSPVKIPTECRPSHEGPHRQATDHQLRSAGGVLPEHGVQPVGDHRSRPQYAAPRRAPRKKKKTCQRLTPPTVCTRKYAYPATGTVLACSKDFLAFWIVPCFL